MSANSALAMVVQLIYAACTSRVLGPEAFGAYAVALAGVGLIGMLGGSSLELSAARRERDSVTVDRSILGVAYLFGLLAMLAGLLLAPAWASLWDVQDSVELTRLLCLGLPLLSLQSVYKGVLRRQGATTRVAGLNATGQIVGIVVGLSAVLLTRDSWSLAVSSLVATLTTLVLTRRWVPKERLWPLPMSREALEDVWFATRAASMNLLRYGSQNIAGWAIARFAGAGALGSYNRATSLITVPLTALQVSFSYALFPELRPDGPVSRSRSALTDIMVLVTWPTVIIGGIGYFAAPPLLRLALGPGWDEAVGLAGVAVLLGLAPMIGVPLGTVFEALGRFRVTLVGWAISTLSVLLGVYFTYLGSSAMPAAIGLLIGRLLSSVWYLVPLSLEGLIQPRGLWRGVRAVLLVQMTVCATLLAPMAALPVGDVGKALLVLGIGGAEIGVLWMFRRRTAFWQLIVSRNLLKGSASQQ